jgi:hypothetical protein
MSYLGLDAWHVTLIVDSENHSFIVVERYYPGRRVLFDHGLLASKIFHLALHVRSTPVEEPIDAAELARELKRSRVKLEVSEEELTQKPQSTLIWEAARELSILALLAPPALFIHSTWSDAANRNQSKLTEIAKRINAIEVIEDKLKPTRPWAYLEASTRIGGISIPPSEDDYEFLFRTRSRSSITVSQLLDRMTRHKVQVYSTRPEITGNTSWC